MADSLQSQLDAITAQTRTLVQPERLAITEQAIHDLLATGIESRILPVGAQAPSFTLPDALTGKPVRSADLLALGPVIINFFRGRWCPYCVTELEAWEAAYPKVRGRGALLVAISPQLPRQNDFTVQQHSLTFPVLSDAGCRVAEMFGVAYTVPEVMRQHLRSIMINIPFVHGDQGEATWRLPVPATFVLKPNADGQATIAFAEAHADHRVRPDPTDVLAAL
ncbi:MAG TPA: peroxiredoxin-like family protein [Acidobacteriaceae bacterium]|nr:peroxiredoxin-like family protein [Acidobacteriaceae bacterium]